jgi:hypothetical protein
MPEKSCCKSSDGNEDQSNLKAMFLLKTGSKELLPSEADPIGLFGEQGEKLRLAILYGNLYVRRAMFQQPS